MRFKATTSILPYLKAKEIQDQGAAEAKALADTSKNPVKPDTKSTEDLKDILRSIHPSATEDELEAMARYL